MLIAVTAMLAACSEETELRTQLEEAEAERDVLRAEVDELRAEAADNDEPGEMRVYSLKEVDGVWVRSEIPITRIPAQ